MKRAADLLDETDDELLESARQNHMLAVAELYRRHRADAHRYARRLTRRHLSPDNADDVVAEAVRKVLSALLHGRGPRHGFRPYLFTAIRTVTATQSLSRQKALLGEHVLDDVGPAGSDASDDTIVAMKAFASLAESWRRVLWATEALDLSTSDAAALLDSNPSAVAAMAMRAREALRVAYVRQYLPSSTDPMCQRALNVLARRVATTAAPVQARFLEGHLSSCPACHRAEQQVAAELEWTRLPEANESA